MSGAGAVVRAAGGVPYRGDGGDPEFLLVHRPKYDDWSLPKGKADAGEDLADTAVREVLEETGMTVEVRRLLGTVAYRVGDGSLKRVRYWLMEARSGSFQPGSEVDAVEWHPAGDASRRLTHPRDRELVAAAARAVARPDAGRVYLVRHVHAGKRSEWPAPDHLRPISALGDDQLDSLLGYLTARPLTYIASSPYVRCVQTVAPLADLLEMGVDEQQPLAEGAPLEESLDLLRKLGGESAALSTHGDVAGGVIEHLDVGGIPLEGPRAWEKGSVWVLEVDGGEIISGSYVPASPAA